jgi:hypothetical protein
MCVNRRNKEFAEEVRELLLLITNSMMSEAHRTNRTAYDVELAVDDIIKRHMTNRMIATETCAYRHFNNLKERDLFIFGKDFDDATIKLNPKFAGADIDLLAFHIRMPENIPM